MVFTDVSEQLPRGYSATIAVGTTTTTAPGTNASVINTGNLNDATFNFSIPRGATGSQGIQGIQGEQGIAGISSSIFTYSFSSQVNGGAPPSGHIYLNNASPNATTSVFVNHKDKPDRDIDAILANVNTNSVLLLQKSNDSNIFIEYTVTGKNVVANSYVEFYVTYNEKAGVIANNDEILMIIQLAGLQGPAGINATNPNFTASVLSSGPAVTPNVTLSGTYPNLNLGFDLKNGTDGTGGSGSDGAIWNVKAVNYHTIAGVYTGVGGVWFLERGATTTLVTAVAAGNARTSKTRVRQPYSSVANGQDSGWFTSNTTGPNLGVYVGSGFKAIFNFGLGDTSTNAETCTFVGLFGDGALTTTSGPTFNNTTTISSFITHSVGLIQEKTHNVWHFYTRGISGNTTVATSIPCTTPSTTFFSFEIYNPPGTNNLILTLVDQGAVTYETVTFVGGTSNVVGLSTPLYFLVQRNMASAGGVTGSAILEATGFKLLTC